MNKYKNKISEYIDNSKDEMLETLARLIAIKSVKSAPVENMPFGKGCGEVLSEYEKICDEMGFTYRNYDNYVVRTFFNDKPSKLGILAHLDVVPEGEGWSSDPYTLTVRDGRAYGRGAIDDKGPAVAVLYAMKCVKELNIPVADGLEFIVGSDEENGSSDIEYYMKKEKFPPMVFTPDAEFPLINGEKGYIRGEFSTNKNSQIISFDGGTVINAVPFKCVVTLDKNTDVERIKKYISEKNYDVDIEENEIFTLTAKGRAAHASVPENGINAIAIMCDILGNCLDDKSLKEIYRLCTVDGIANEDTIADNNGTTGVVSVAHSQGDIITFKADIRFNAPCTLEEKWNSVCDRLKATSVISDINRTLALEPHFTDPNSNFVRTLLGVYEDITGEKGEALTIGGLTYVHDIENGVAFGVEFPGEENNMHSPDESINIDNLLICAKIYANSIIELIGEKGI